MKTIAWILNLNGKVSDSIDNEQESRGQGFLQTGLILFGVIIIVLAWSLTLHQVKESRGSLLAGLEREQKNLTAVLAENLFQILEQKQAIELFALRWFGDRQEKSLKEITGFLYGERSFTRVVLYEKTGKPFYQSSPHHRTNIDMKAYIQEMLDSGAPVFVLGKSEPPKASWQIPILFPLKKGSIIKGAMLLELDLGYLLNLLQDIRIGRTGKITIKNTQSDVLASFESGGLVMNNSILKSPFIGSMQNPSGSGVFKIAGLSDFHLAYLHVRDYPFIIIVSQGLDEFFSDFGQQRRKLIWILSIFTLFYISGSYLLLKIINRNYQYLDALAVANQENNDLIQKLEQEHQASTKAASFDSLTGLYNRRLFISLAQKSLSLAKRNKFSYAILFIDLDRFKKINDTLGHRIGDLLLKTVSERLVSCIRKSDIVARFGGDEFVVMLTELSTEQNITPVVEKIISTISEPCKNLDGHEILTSPSVGIAVYPRDGVDVETMLRNADAAMYKAKKSGRGRFSFFDTSLNTVSVQKFELEQRMPAAIREGEFVLYYQPKIRLEDYRVVGLEALIRWQQPHHQLIFPSDFIGIAEETGLISELGNQVLESACRQMALWLSAGLDPVPVSINVSPMELKDKNYSRNFFETLSHHNLSADRIEVEITENAFIEEKTGVIKNLEDLYSRGVRISLDDFGKGFSSLDHIRKLPISTLKIDRTFVQDIRNSFNDSPIVSSTIILAQKLNMTVVAEGVETHDQLVNLKVAGCDQVQGYYFSRPVPEEKIRDFIISPIRSISA